MKYITLEGLNNLKEELNERKTQIRDQIADKLAVAKAQGDLSENAAYHSAMEEYQMNESKIRQLVKEISTSVVAPDKSDNDVVDVGDRVKLEDIETHKEIEYQIVGEGEGDPLQNKLSHDSEMGKNIIGKRKGDMIKVNLPKAVKEFRLTEIL